MRRVRYCVAVSLDGFIAGPKGEFDWIIMDADFDFATFEKEFDTVLMGRRTFEVAGGGSSEGMQTIVCSRTLSPKDHPKLTLTADAVTTVRDLKKSPGKDIWLFGGGELFRSLLDARLVDTIELGVMPILLGEGIRVLPGGPRSPALKLVESKTFKSGTVSLIYAIDTATALPKPRRKAKR